MNGDFTRDTFRPGNHFRQVLMQQGRVQIDSDWNEASAIASRRDETTTADIVGHCGGPADGAAFGVVSSLADPAKVPDAVAKWFDALEAAEQARITNALATGGFLLTPGRYYVDGIQCELEAPVLFDEQPDLPGQNVANGSTVLLYLDVWPRHLTALEVPALLDSALGGVDTATRVKTVWQVRTLALDGGIPSAACSADIAKYNSAIAPSAIRLSAQTEAVPNTDDPCQVPEASGYKGLENQLYRVEIHEVNNDGSAKNFKWSRENGSVVSRLLKIDKVKKELTVESLGRDDNLGFAADQWVEIIDDEIELAGAPGQLIQIDQVDPGRLVITLKTAPNLLITDVAFPDGIVPARHPKIRRWDGRANANAGWLPLESGIQVRFDDPDALSHTGDYWQISARAATPNAMAGDIEWPRKPGADGNPDPHQPISLLPRGIHRHYCRLGFYVTNPPAGTDKFTDCRCLWPSLTNLPRIFYVSGDGQEVMPVPGEPLLKLPQPLIVGVANEHCAPRALKVRFTVEVPGAGEVTIAGGNVAAAANHVDVPVGTDGLASCDFYLDNSDYSQRVSALLLDEIGTPVGLSIFFNATLSIANQVAYDPGDCGALQGQNTVQLAIARLASLVRIEAVGGDGQDAKPGEALAKPIQVLATCACGPVPNAVIHFAAEGAGLVALTAADLSPPRTNQLDVTTGPDGLATVLWKPDAAGSLTQQLTATLTQPDNSQAKQPGELLFTANFRSETETDPAQVRIVGLRFGRSPQVLANGQTLSPDDLVADLDSSTGALVVLCDQAVLRNTVIDPTTISLVGGPFTRGQPTCFVTVEVPYPLTPAERAGWDLGPRIVGYRPVILDAIVNSAEIPDGQPPPGPPLPQGLTARGMIIWWPSQPAVSYLRQVLAFLGNVNPRPDKVLARLTLKGNFIWSEQAPALFNNQTPGGFLDGDSFRAPPEFGESELLLPSGDGRRGGDFEMWFWLAANVPLVITKHPQSVTVHVGASPTFDVAVNLSEGVSFQWQRNAVVIPGAIAASLTVNQVTLADNGATFQVRVSKADESVTSQTAILTVQGPKLSDKVDHKPVADVKITEHLSAPGAKPARPRKARAKRRSGGKAFIRKKERPVMDPGTP